MTSRSYTEAIHTLSHALGELGEAESRLANGAGYIDDHELAAMIITASITVSTAINIIAAKSHESLARELKEISDRANPQTIKQSNP